MTREQYLAIYERERQKSTSVADAAHTVFRALNREVIYRMERRVALLVALQYANAVWQYLADQHNEIRPDGFKNLMRLYIEKNGDRQLRDKILTILEFI